MKKVGQKDDRKEVRGWRNSPRPGRWSARTPGLRWSRTALSSMDGGRTTRGRWDEVGETIARCDAGD